MLHLGLHASLLHSGVRGQLSLVIPLQEAKLATSSSFELWTLYAVAVMTDTHDGDIRLEMGPLILNTTANIPHVVTYARSI